MYSSIKKKNCKCSDHCAYLPTLGFSGYHIAHAPENIREAKIAKKKDQQKKANLRLREKTKINKLVPNQDNEAAKRQKHLNDWFKYHMDNAERVCENCGADLRHYNDKDWRSCQDHIIEKSKINGCPSVAAELSNHCVLGLWCLCHGQKHTSHYNLSKMNIFSELKKRFKTFEHLIKEEERRKIPDIFYSL